MGRFLQQQDRNTEKYFGLLEKYIDHPDRDRIIAQEMGWESFDEDRDAEWDEEAEEFCEEELNQSDDDDEDDDDDDEESDGDFEEFSRSPIYQDTLKLHTWINSWLDRDSLLKDHPEAVRLATRSAVCGAKLRRCALRGRPHRDRHDHRLPQARPEGGQRRPRCPALCSFRTAK